MAVASGYEVVNDKGDRAWFDDTTGQLFPMPPKVKVEPGTQMQKGDIERGILQTMSAQEDARNAKRTAPGPVDQERVAKVEQDLRATQPYKVRNDKGDEAMFDPNTGAMTPIRKKEAPRVMGGAPTLDINEYLKTGQKKIIPPQHPEDQGSYGLAAALLTPSARIPAAIGGAVTSAAEDIGKGKMPSPTGMAVGAAGGFASPEIAKAGKAVLRGAGRMFGSGPLKKAAGQVYEETKAITKPVNTPETEKELLSQSATFGRTAPEQQEAAVTRIFDRIANAKTSGKPLTYGEVFNNATQLNQEITNLYKGKYKEAAGQLDTLREKMMNDLAASGPEAADAVAKYKRAVGMFGGYGGVVQAVKKITGLGVGAGTALAAALKPGTMYVSAPAALIGGIVNLSERLPFGVGQGIARALIEDPGKLSQGAVRALVGAINSGVKEKEVY